MGPLFHYCTTHYQEDVCAANVTSSISCRKQSSRKCNRRAGTLLFISSLNLVLLVLSEETGLVGVFGTSVSPIHQSLKAFSKPLCKTEFLAISQRSTFDRRNMRAAITY